MGGCASKPKESNSNSPLDKNPASYEQTPEDFGGDPTIENGADVETENKEKPLLGTLDPKQDTPSSDGEFMVEPCISEAGVEAADLGSNDSEKVSEAAVEAADLTQESKTTDGVLVLETRKSDAGGEEKLSNLEGLEEAQCGEASYI